MALVLGVSKAFPRLVAVMLVGIMASACSTIPDWVDPTSWFGPDVPDRADTASDSPYPNLADMPDKPASTSTGDERKQLSDSLAAARGNVQYSAEVLRGGTEAAAAPPPAAPPPEQVARAEERAESPPAASEAAAIADETAVAQPDDTQAASPAAPTEKVATVQESPSSAVPAVPAVPEASGPGSSVFAGVPPAAVSDSALGFQRSKAPPLDASVAQFVPQPIIARFAQTASVGAPATPAIPAGDVALKAPSGTGAANLGTGEDDVGGPESMSGAVVADLGVLQSPGILETGVYADPAGIPPASVVFFPGDTTALNAEARKAARAAAADFLARGGHGYIRVVGHSASRTPNMPVLRHLELIFRKSQERAVAVAHELIKDGVPAKQVLINAVGDSQPVYYESMPKGEDGNRRAEIFFQS